MKRSKQRSHLVLTVIIGLTLSAFARSLRVPALRAVQAVVRLLEAALLRWVAETHLLIRLALAQWLIPPSRAPPQILRPRTVRSRALGLAAQVLLAFRGIQPRLPIRAPAIIAIRFPDHQLVLSRVHFRTPPVRHLSLSPSRRLRLPRRFFLDKAPAYRLRRRRFPPPGSSFVNRNIWSTQPLPASSTCRRLFLPREGASSLHGNCASAIRPRFIRSD